MIRLGIIGTGLMAKKHARNFRACEDTVISACCEIVKEKAEAFARKYRIKRVYTDWRAMLEKEDLDAVSVVTPDSEHAEIAIGASEAGLHVFCEKPLSTNLSDAKRMYEAVKKAGVINMVNFSYRDSAALQKASEFIRSGAIGEVKHLEASYLQSWLVSRVWGDWRKNPALTWRLSTAHGSLGVLGDLGCHIYDAARFLVGDFSEIYCRLVTFEKGVPGGKLGPYGLDANDSFVSVVIFKNGALGAIHSSRWAVGHINSVRLRVYGEGGAVEVDLDKGLSRFRLCKGTENIDRGRWRWVSCAPTPTCYQRFIQSIRTGTQDPCDFRNALEIQIYLDASFRSHETGKPVSTSDYSVHP